jgi:protein tyrosine phosphatase (PTP) superfamily phosphohydrolase (DUF442 family)
LTRRRKWLAGIASLGVVLLAVYFAGPYWLRTGRDQPPLNYVAIHERLATAGQPSPAQLRRLRADGYEVLINLAPPGSYGSVADEGDIVSRLGMVYVNIPVDWKAPAERDFRFFADLLKANRDRRVLVHCQMNMRASVFVFLYRILYEAVPVDVAATAVTQVWQPNATWRGFMDTLLKPRRGELDFWFPRAGAPPAP